MRYRIIKVQGGFEPQMQSGPMDKWTAMDPKVFLTLDAAHEWIKTYKQKLTDHSTPEIVWEGE